MLYFKLQRFVNSVRFEHAMCTVREKHGLRNRLKHYPSLRSRVNRGTFLKVGRCTVVKESREFKEYYEMKCYYSE